MHATVVHSFGDGPNVLVGLHGWNSTGRVFERLSKALGSGYTMHGIDLPGLGESSPPPDWERTTIQRCINDAVEDLEIESFALVGECSGLLFCTGVAERFPEKTEHIFGLEPFPELPEYLELFSTPVLGRLAFAAAFQNRLGRAIGEWVLSREYPGASGVLDSFVDVGAAPYHYVQCFSDRSIEKLPKLGAIPKTLMFAERSFEAITSSRNDWQNRWPEVETLELEGTGHLFLKHDPDALAAVISDRF